MSVRRYSLSKTILLKPWAISFTLRGFTKQAASPVTSGTAYRMLFTFMTLYAFNEGKEEEALWEFYDKLDKNIHHYTRKGDAPTDLVAKGEFMLAITNAKYVQPRIEEGYPLVWCVPKEGIGYESTPVFILKSTKELYTCQKIIDLFAILEFSKLRAEMGFISKDPEAASALYKHLPGGVPKFVPNIDLKWAYENKARLNEEWKARYILKQEK